VIDYQRLYEYRFRNVDQGRRERVWEAIAPMIWERMGRPERLLDPAAGRCEFINAAPARERWGVDAVKYEEANLREGTRLIVSNIMQAELPAAHFDGIFVSNFLEHLSSPDEVAGFLAKMRDCAKPGGRIAVMGPNFRCCPREYFDYADHIVILTEQSAAEHLYAAGFTVDQVHPRFLPYSFAGRVPTHPALVRAYLRTPPAWRLLGKQFLVIATRPPVNQD
jgi:SAM-dependent methyltransferase